jgi:capsular exopolysaccharide synthesis family protein
VTTPPPEADGAGISIDFRRIFETLQKYFWILLLFLVAGTVATIAYLNTATPIYASYALLKVEQRVRDAAPTMSDGGSFEDLRAMEMVATIQRAFLSRSLMMQVADKMKLAERKGFLRKNVPADERQAAVLKQLMKNTDAQVLRGTRLIQISFEHPDPDLAAEVLSTIISEYKLLDADQRLKAASGVLDYLTRERVRLEKQLSTSQEEQSSYTKNLGSVSIDGEMNIIAEQLKELNTRLTLAKADRLKLEADYEQVQQYRNDPQALLQIESVSKLTEIQQARTSLNEIDGEIGKLRERYGANSPQLTQLLSQRKGLQEALYAEALRAPKSVEIALRAASQNEKSLERETQTQEKKTIAVKEAAIKWSVMQRQIDADQLAYKSVCERLNGEESQARSQAIFLQTIDPPSAGAKVKPRVPLVIAVALVASLGLGAATIFLLALLDTSMKSVDEAEQVLGVHVLSAVPQLGAPTGKQKGKTVDKESSLARIPLLEDQHSTVSEAFRTLRASLLLLEDTQPFVMITSATPAEGKSFCSINLAVAIAQQGMRTVIVDMDLRKPVIETRLFEKGSYLGVADFLSGRAEFDEIVRETHVPNLYAITAGRRYPNMAELLLRHDRLRELLKHLESDFDRTVVDSAPVLAVSDTLNIARHFKTIALVARSHRTPRGISRRAADVLARTGHPICGVILNAIPAKSASYYYYYSYTKNGKAYGDHTPATNVPAEVES